MQHKVARHNLAEVEICLVGVFAVTNVIQLQIFFVMEYANGCDNADICVHPWGSLAHILSYVGPHSHKVPAICFGLFIVTEPMMSSDTTSTIVEGVNDFCLRFYHGN